MKEEKMRREKIKIKAVSRNFLLPCVIIIIITATAAMGQTESDQPQEESVYLDRADSGIAIGIQRRFVADDSFLNQPVQSISFRKDMSITDALRFLAVKYHRNIIPSPQVSGRLNVTNLYNVTFQEALDAILGSEYRYKTSGTFIRVYTAAEYEKLAKDIENMTSRVYTLNYINAAEVKALITPIMSEFGKIASTSAAATDTEAGTGGDKFSMKDTIVVYDFPERLDRIGEMIKAVDVMPQQILIEVTVLEATLTETTNFGINWQEVGVLTSDAFSFTANLSNSTATAFTANVIGNDKLAAAITAQEGITDTTILANPKIMALNKQAGYLNIGEERGYNASTTQGQTTTTSVDFLESGTILRFRPFICDNGYIRMEINPELSSGTLQDVNAGLPLKTITTVKTNIMVKDGETIIIAGMFREQLTNTDTQVPIIGDIPIIGHLFKKTTDENIRKELVVLITPHIIDEPEELASASEERANDVSRIVEGSRKRMNPIARARIYEWIYSEAVKHYTDKEYDKALSELNWIIGFRPNAVEAVQLKEKILSEVRPDRYRALERIMCGQIQKELNVMWKRR